MKNLLAAIESRVDAFNSIKNLFLRHTNLSYISFDYYIEEDDSQLLIRFPKLTINEQTWDEDKDEDGYGDNGFWGYGDFSSITNSELLTSEELDELESCIQTLLYDDCESDIETIIINREEILNPNIRF